MPIIDPITRDYAEMARKVAACCRDRLKTERFCAEVDRMMKLRAQRRPKEMAQACIDERAKKLIQSGKAGWARDPSRPRQAILVDKQGCVLTDLDNKPIKPWTGANVHIPASSAPAYIRAVYAPKVTSAEGKITHIYGDKIGNPTVGIGHRIKGEQDLFVIHERYGFYKRRDDGEPGIEKASFEDVLKDYRKIENLHLHDHPAHHFWQFTTVDLMPSDIISLRDQDIEVHLAEILTRQREFPHYMTYPLPAQLALLDLVFNRGGPTVLGKSPLMEAVRSRNWSAASKSLFGETEPSRDRVRMVQRWFDEAAKKEPFFIDPKCRPKALLHV